MNANWGNFGNVLDEYKGMETEDIKAKIKEKTLPFAPFMMQIQGDFNFSTLIRNANAFGAREAFYFGRKKFDSRGAVGTVHYTDVNYIRSMEEIVALRSRYPHFVAIEIVPGVSHAMHEHVWQPGSLLFFGEEGQGLAPEILEMCDQCVHIVQRGSVRSLNVGTASGIALRECMLKLSECDGES